MAQDCPKEGCPTFQVGMSELRKDVEFVSKELVGSIAQARECLDNFSVAHTQFTEAHNSLLLTMTEHKEIIKSQSSRLKDGVKRFEEIELDAKELDSRVDKMETTVAVLKDHDDKREDPLTKKQAGAVGAASGGAVVSFVEFCKMVFGYLTGG